MDRQTKEVMDMQNVTQKLRRFGPAKWVGAGLLVLGMIAASAPASAADPTAGQLVFVCKFGSMKSQMAAAYFNRIAKERGLQVTAISRAFHPDKDIPVAVRTNMATEGLAPTNEEITSITPDEAKVAFKVISFDEIPQENIGTTNYTHWPNSPKAKKEYWMSMGFIKQHVHDEVDQLVEQLLKKTVGQR
jgi:protein-tyrosine-phosphatase